MLQKLLKKKMSDVMSGGTTTKYFSLGRDARQSDPISAFLFILVLEILFILMKSKPFLALFWVKNKFNKI